MHKNRGIKMSDIFQKKKKIKTTQLSMQEIFGD